MKCPDNSAWSFQLYKFKNGESNTFLPLNDNTLVDFKLECSPCHGVAEY